MSRYSRLVVLFLLGLYALAGGMVASPFAASGSNCVVFAAGDDGCPSGCDPACPAVFCTVSPYVAPLPQPSAAAPTVRQIRYAAARPPALASRTPDPALRPPNA